MNLITITLLSQIILFPAIVALVRFKTIRMDYQPFFWLLMIGVVEEAVSYVSVHFLKVNTNALPTNIYILCEWFLLAIQFHQWGFLKGHPNAFYALLFGTAFIWILENIILGHINSFRPYFPFCYCFVIVILSVREINFLITHDNRLLSRNPRFLICIGFIIFFIYRIIFEWAYQLSLLETSDFTTTVIFLFSYINALTNIIFGIGLLLVRREQTFKLE